LEAALELSCGPDLEAAAGRLAGADVMALTPVAGGANNRVYRVVRGDGTAAALKTYLTPEDDGSERLRAEVVGLEFLRTQGMTGVPKVIAFDEAAGCALLEWIDGARMAEPGEADRHPLLQNSEGIQRAVG